MGECALHAHFEQLLALPNRRIRSSLVVGVARDESPNRDSRAHAPTGTLPAAFASWRSPTGAVPPPELNDASNRRAQ